MTSLEPGYYRCITPVHEIEQRSVGGRRNRTSVNMTALGYLVCVLIDDENVTDTVSALINEQQNTQYQKLGTAITSGRHF